MKDEEKFFKCTFDWNVAWCDLRPLARRFIALHKEKALGVMTKIAVNALWNKQPVAPALKNALKPGRSDKPDAGAADPAVVERACANASDLVNGYVSPRYTIPLASPPALIKTIAVRLAIYYLHMDRNSLTEDINKQYDRDIAFLKMVGEGKASLGDPVSAPEGDVSPGVQIEADDREFTRGKMDGW